MPIPDDGPQRPPPVIDPQLLAESEQMPTPLQGRYAALPTPRRTPTPHPDSTGPVLTPHSPNLAVTPVRTPHVTQYGSPYVFHADWAPVTTLPGPLPPTPNPTPARHADNSATVARPVPSPILHTQPPTQHNPVAPTIVPPPASDTLVCTAAQSQASETSAPMPALQPPHP